MDDAARLRAVKLVHTAVWAVFAGATIAIPVFAWRRDWPATLWAFALVSLECVILLFNRMRCPLTPLAARYTDRREDNFDIYLPLWLARYNKHVFGTLFVIGLLLAAYRRYGGS